MLPDLGQIIFWLGAYKYFILFPLLILEGPIITVIIGFLSSLGELNFFVAYVFAVLANLISDSILYLLGRWGGKLKRFSRPTPGQTSVFEEHFKNHKIKTLFASKMALGIGNLGLIAAGIARVPYLEYIKINFIIELPKALALLLVGFYFGYAYQAISHYLDYATIFLVIGGGIFIFAYWFFRKWLRSQI